MNKILTSVVLIGLLLTAGCGTMRKVLSPELVRQGTAASVSYSAYKWPEAIPGIRIGQEVICSAATGEDISPRRIMADVQILSDQLSTEAKMGINGAMFLYTAVWNSYGDDAVNKIPELEMYLRATCDGIGDGLPTATGGIPTATSALRSLPPSAAVKWPMAR